MSRKEPRPDITLGPAAVVALWECFTCEPGGLLMDEPDRAAQCLEGNHNVRAQEMPMRHNQETLGNGCVCDSGCESCDALADAFEAMREALAYLRMCYNARAALDLSDKVIRHG